jgi:hypothetical protein
VAELQLYDGWVCLAAFFFCLRGFNTFVTSKSHAQSVASSNMPENPRMFADDCPIPWSNVPPPGSAPPRVEPAALQRNPRQTGIFEPVDHQCKPWKMRLTRSRIGMKIAA